MAKTKDVDVLEEAQAAFALLDFDSQRDYLKQLQEAHQGAVEAKRAELLAQLQALGGLPPAAKPRGRPAGTGEGKGNRASPPVKYRDPATGEGWSGRGRPASWLQKYIDAGRDKSEFLVQD